MNENEDKKFNPDEGSIFSGKPLRMWDEDSARREQQMFDEADVRKIIRAIRENADLRRELLQVLGIQEMES